MPGLISNIFTPDGDAAARESENGERVGAESADRNGSDNGGRDSTDIDQNLGLGQSGQDSGDGGLQDLDCGV